MTRVRTLALSLALLVLAAGTAEASWYDDYDAGLAAAKKGNWNVVVQKMTAAIKGNPKEDNKARAYGVIFYNYHPYYYRGIAHLNLGNYEQAIADLEKTRGPGDDNLGDIGTHLDRAKRQLAASNDTTPEPVRPTPEPARPTPTPAVTQPQPSAPAVPTIDPNLRSRASGALNSAKTKLQAAQTRKATASPQYAQAMSMFTDATTKNATARSNDDLNAIIDMAENAASLAELAMPPAVAPTPATIVPAPGITPKPAAATTAILEDYSREVRTALENYFAGEFEAATTSFRDLSRKMPNNGWIWAFLGASQYSLYAFEAEESYRTEALKSFARAKQLRRWNGGLPQKYFSKRIRNAFDKTSS